MKALSIQQPWAYCITNGTKRVENRVWEAHYRGPLLLHAGKRYQTGMEHAIHADSPEVDLLGMRRAPRGAIVGACRIISCVPPGGDVAPDQLIWSDPDQYKFVLVDVRAFAEPIPWKGMLQIFDVPDDVVRAALAAAAVQGQDS